MNFAYLHRVHTRSNHHLQHCSRTIRDLYWELSLRGEFLGNRVNPCTWKVYGHTLYINHDYNHIIVKENNQKGPIIARFNDTMPYSEIQKFFNTLK